MCPRRRAGIQHLPDTRAARQREWYRARVLGRGWQAPRSILDRRFDDALGGGRVRVLGRAVSDTGSERLARGPTTLPGHVTRQRLAHYRLFLSDELALRFAGGARGEVAPRTANIERVPRIVPAGGSYG